jgi:hypothetical protein
MWSGRGSIASVWECPVVGAKRTYVEAVRYEKCNNQKCATAIASSQLVQVRQLD